MNNFVSVSASITLERLRPGGSLSCFAGFLSPSGSLYDLIAETLLADVASENTQSTQKIGVAGSGSLCLAFARAAARAGKKLLAVVPESTLPEHLILLRQHEAELVTCNGGLFATHEALTAREGATFCYSPAKPGRAAEVFERSLGQVLEPALRDVQRVVAPVGSGALLSALSKLAAGREMVGTVAPEGSRQDGVARRVDHDPDGFTLVEISDERAHQARIALARSEGLLVGMGSAAAVSCALDGPKTTLVVLVDAGDRYFSVDAAMKAGAP